MKNLQQIDEEIQNGLSNLADFDWYSGYQEQLNKLIESIKELYKFFGIGVLKRDIGAFHSGETAIIEQDESGTWLCSLDGSKSLDLYEYMIPLEDIFYE